MILNVDFDYFIREEPNWDWQHAEFGGGLVDVLWRTRAQAFMWRGQDLHQETGFHHVTPEPMDFIATLEEVGFTFESGLPIVASCSHLYAYLQIEKWLHDGMCANKILSFDAHHDMGYKSEKELRSLFDRGRIDCADWQYHLLRRYKFLREFQIYPGWKGDREVTKGRCSWKARPSLKSRFDTGVFSVDLLREHKGHVTGIFLAKSDAWTPPWHDHVVADFAGALEARFGSKVETPFVGSPNERDPLCPRDWNMQAVTAEAEFFKKMVEDQRVKKVG